MYKHGRYKMLIALLFILGDVIILNLLFFSMLYAKHLDFNNLYQIIYILINLGYLLSYAAISIEFHETLTQLLWDNFQKLTITAFILITCLFFLKIADNASRFFIMMYFSAAWVLVTSNQWLTQKLVTIALRKKFNKGIILGAGALGEKIFDDMLHNVYNGVIILGFFDDNPGKNSNDVSGTIEEAKDFILKNGVTDVFCTLPKSADEKITDFIKFAEKHVLNFHIVPDIGYYYTGTTPIITTTGNMPVFLLRHIPLSYVHNAMIKRSFDIFISFIAIITLFPILFPVLAILIKKSSPGPILFKQKRTGERGKEFTCYKLRSMRMSDDANFKQATLHDDRKTKVGDFLRKTSLDELPQFFNVLMGNMSIVGPRPHMLRHTSEYSPQVDKYMVRHFVKPGITGLAQVRGFRGETKDVELMVKRVLSDVEYVENWTLWMDLKIIFKTVLLVIKGDEKAF